jgi:hypothetical protein
MLKSRDVAWLATVPSPAALRGKTADLYPSDRRSRLSRRQAWLSRYLPKCGTVNAIRPRSPE